MRVPDAGLEFGSVQRTSLVERRPIEDVDILVVSPD